MPLLAESSFYPAPGLHNGHLQTIWPVFFRHTLLVTNQRERLELPDGDFLDLDWARHESGKKVRKKLVVFTHGLEGGSRDTNIQSMAAVFFKNKWDVLAWSMRGCSGEPNRLLRFYHSGATEDLATVLDHVTNQYENIALIGFSLGGNITLKYLGETTSPNIHGAVAFSVPCDLTSSVNQLDQGASRFYTRRFIRHLRAKIYEKKKRFPDALDVSQLAAMRTFHEFDSAYTAPLHGFASADDYWKQASSLPLLASINVPTLLVNAANDPFLGKECFPSEIARQSVHFHLEIPKSGGHCGFVGPSQWQEKRALEFLENGTTRDNIL